MDWFPQRHVDHAEMALAAVNWMLEEKHKTIGEYHDGTFTQWSRTRSRSFPFHYRDGVRLWVSKYDLTPEADWL